MNDLRELLAKATPGLWEVWPGVRPGIEADGFSVVVYGTDEQDDLDGVQRAEDAELIVAAVNALPALLDENDRLRAAVLDSLTIPARTADTCWLPYRHDDPSCPQYRRTK